MSSGFTEPSSCGFARSLAFLLSTNKIENEYNQTVTNQHKYFSENFTEVTPNFNISLKHYMDNINTLKKAFARFSKDNAVGRALYLQTFHPDMWSVLSLAVRKQHSINDCQYCAHHYTNTQATFPKTSRINKRKADSKVCSFTKQLKLPAGPLKDITKEVYHNINSKFAEQTGIEFVEALTGVKSFRIEKKKTKIEKKKQLRNLYRKNKDIIEEHYNKTSVLRYNLDFLNI